VIGDSWSSGVVEYVAGGIFGLVWFGLFCFGLGGFFFMYCSTVGSSYSGICIWWKYCLVFSYVCLGAFSYHVYTGIYIAPLKGLD